MSTIDTRKIINTTFRVRLRNKYIPTLSLTFSLKKEAETWVEEHEEKYLENPEIYHKWIKENRKSIKKNGIFHIHIPLERFN